jgi:hypothetical protein
MFILKSKFRITVHTLYTVLYLCMYTFIEEEILFNSHYPFHTYRLRFLVVQNFTPENNLQRLITDLLLRKICTEINF